MSNQPNDRGPSHLPGVFQSLVAAFAGGVCQPGVSFGWVYCFHSSPPAWLDATLPNAVAAAAVFAILWSTARFCRQQLVQRRHATAISKGDRISIIVSQLDGDDATGNIQELLIHTLRRVFSGNGVEIIPAGFCLRPRKDLSVDKAIQEVTDDARNLKIKYKGDLLIWGRIYSISGITRLLLYFVSSTTFGAPVPSEVMVTPDLQLGPKFLADLSAALARAVQDDGVFMWATPANRSSRKFTEKWRAQAANRMEKLRKSLPVGLPAADREKILETYVMVQLNSECNEDKQSYLLQAVKACREVLERRSLQDTPEDLARHQHNLGTALQALAEVENNVERLIDAVTAYRAACDDELNETNFQSDWYNDLGLALVELGTRTNRTEWFEDAVRAFVKIRENDRDAWVGIFSNHCLALIRLGNLSGNVHLLEEAALICREVIKERPYKKARRTWARAQSVLGIALCKWASNLNDASLFGEALAAAQAAQMYYTKARHLEWWANEQLTICDALLGIGRTKREILRLNEAMTACVSAIKATRIKFPILAENFSVIKSAIEAEVQAQMNTYSV